MADDPMTVISFSHPWEAHLAKSRLESEGITVSLADEHTVGMNWLYSNAVGGVKVQVAAEDFTRAQQILQSEVDQDLQEGSTDPTIACPACDSSPVDYVQTGKRLTYLSWLLLGFPILFLRTKLRCRQCGCTWKEPRGK
jgi:hypothetical protein